MDNYNLHVNLAHIRGETHFKEIRIFLEERGVRIHDLIGSRFKVRFSNEEQTEEFLEFLRKFENGNPGIFVFTYKGKRKIESMSGLLYS